MSLSERDKLLIKIKGCEIRNRMNIEFFKRFYLFEIIFWFAFLCTTLDGWVTTIGGCIFLLYSLWKYCETVSNKSPQCLLVYVGSKVFINQYDYVTEELKAECAKMYDFEPYIIKSFVMCGEVIAHYEINDKVGGRVKLNKISFLRKVFCLCAGVNLFKYKE